MASAGLSRSSSARRLIIVAAFLLAAAAGAYLDWIWWHPMKGITVTLAAIVTLVVGAVAQLGPTLARRAGLVLLAVGVGLLAGQLLGPAREPPTVVDGTITLRLERPVVAVSEGRADCSIVPSGTSLTVSGDPNLRLRVDGVPAERQPFASVGASVGDMWAPDFGRRDDELAVSIALSPSIEIGDTGPGESVWRSTPASRLDYAPGADAGSGALSFSGLERTGGIEGSVITGGELVGTIEWTC